MMDFIAHFAAVAAQNQVNLNNRQSKLQELIQRLRPQLGPQEYLLQNYLRLVLEICNEVTLMEAANDGFNYFAELRKLCRTIMAGDTEAEQHPFYNQAKTYILQHPLPYQERGTRLSLYCLLLGNVFIEQATQHYLQQLQQSLEKTYDLLYLQELRQQICAHLRDHEQMDQLDQWLLQCYLAVSPLQGFTQGLTHEVMYILTSTDPETGQSILQLWLKHQD